MFSLEKDTSFMFTELAMAPNDAGTCFEGINLLPENNHIARPKSPKYMFTERLAISLAYSSFGFKLGVFSTYNSEYISISAVTDT